MEDFWSGFIGVIVGALASFGTLLITNRQLNRVADREAAERANVRRRETVAALLGVVSQDIATFRGEIAPVQTNGSQQQFADFLDEMLPRIGTAADLARAVGASVQDAAVREAAQAVYDAWYMYAYSQSETIVNATKKSMTAFASEASTGAPNKFYKAVETYLEGLDAVK